MKEVIILYGGNSDENEISELTANSIHKHIDRKKFLPTLLNLNDFKVDEIDRDSIIFIAIHGAGGEDGKIQKILNEKEITFTGSDQKSCENCWNKIRSKKILIENQLPTPEYFVSSKNKKFSPDADFLNYQGGFFVKPNSNGSSLGISKIKNGEGLQDAINLANKFSEEVIIEKAYNHSEYTVSILNGEVLEPLQILPDSNRDFYDYKAKYESIETKKTHLNDQDLKEELKSIALKAFFCHGCRIWGRVDFVFDGKILGILEINTVPGFTEKSLFPLAAKKSGINYQELITMIIEGSIKGK
tara:strand:+ start:279 stop:1181 length:903 start_codon:yes stop_codon:yes gene_type:complete